MQNNRRSPGIAKYDREKLSQIREKVSVIFGVETTMDDSELSQWYTVTNEGDLVMILR